MRYPGSRGSRPLGPSWKTLATGSFEDGLLHAEAPADLHIETLVEGPGSGPRGTLEKLRPEPGDLLPKDGGQITGFRLSLFKGMGSTRGSAESGFIRSVDAAVDRFHSTVVTQLEHAPARRPQPDRAAATV